MSEAEAARTMEAAKSSYRRAQTGCGKSPLTDCRIRLEATNRPVSVSASSYRDRHCRRDVSAPGMLAAMYPRKSFVPT